MLLEREILELLMGVNRMFSTFSNLLELTYRRNLKAKLRCTSTICLLYLMHFFLIEFITYRNKLGRKQSAWNVCLVKVEIEIKGQ